MRTIDSDKTLIRRVRQGEEEALSELVCKYYDDVLAYSRCHCYSREIAEDITQETFLHFFAALPTYRHCGKLKNMLLTIARNLIYNEHTKKGAEPTEQFFLDLDQNKVSRSDISDDDRIELRMEIEQALTLLPEQLSKIIVLYYFQGYSLAEISRQEKISLSNAKYRLVKARRELKRFFEETGHE